MRAFLFGASALAAAWLAADYWKPAPGRAVSSRMPISVQVAADGSKTIHLASQGDGVERIIVIAPERKNRIDFTN